MRERLIERRREQERLRDPHPRITIRPLDEPEIVAPREVYEVGCPNCGGDVPVYRKRYCSAACQRAQWYARRKQRYWRDPDKERVRLREWRARKRIRETTKPVQPAEDPR